MSEDIIQAWAFSAPAACALVCMIMVLLDVVYTKKNRQERLLRLFLSLTYLAGILCWTGLVLQAVNHAAFVRYSSVFALTLMLDQILVFRFVHIITATGENGNHFNRLHFAFPVLMTLTSVITDLAVPFEQQEAAIYDGGSGWFAALYSLTGVIFVVYNSLYPVLGILRIRRYRRCIEDYSADRQRNSLNWLVVMLAATLLTVPVPFAGLFFNMDVFSGFWFSIQGVLPCCIVYLILCYNLLSDNYVIILPADESLPDKISEIDRKRFERYLHEKKPYLNPQLRITDIAADLCSNRNYISAFINGEYDMNFSRLINRCRLQELEQLRTSPAHADDDNLGLILAAGFSNYRSYRRAKQEEDKSKELKAF